MGNPAGIVLTSDYLSEKQMQAIAYKVGFNETCFETSKSYAHMHGRHFSSPISGTIEDPVTGTASGVMGAYYITFIDTDANELELIVEQGQEINRDGDVLVKIKRNGTEIKIVISGTAVYTNEMNIEYE